MTVAGIRTGSAFRKMVRLGNVSERVLDQKLVNDIYKQPAAMTGLDPEDLSVQGFRSEYLTELAKRGIPLTEGDRAIIASVGAVGEIVSKYCL